MRQAGDLLNERCKRMNERMKILEMVEQGKISAKEGAELLLAVEPSASKVESVEKRLGEAGSEEMNYLKIRVFEGNLEKPKVSVNIPLALAKLGMQFIPKEKLDNVKINDKPFDLNEILRDVSENFRGELLNVEETGEDGKQTLVKIFIE